MSTDTPTIAERIEALRARWPKEPAPEAGVTHIRGNGAALSNLTLAAGIDNPRALFIGLSQWIYDGQTHARRQQVGMISRDDLENVLRQFCLAFGADTVINATLAVPNA